jgi:hypothetical protein
MCRDTTRKHRDGLPATRTARYAAFLDLSKAYDSMEYSIILTHLMSIPNFPITWVEMLRNVLPGNSTTILGERIAFTRGLPQGGALCPFLCLAFMDSYATQARARHAARAPAPTPVWPTVDPASMHWWVPRNVRDFDLRQYTYADDLSLMAATLPELQEDLDGAYAWSEWACIEWSDKSFITLLSATNTAHPPPDDVVRLGPDLILPWCNQPFPYLGVGTHPGHSAKKNRTGGRQKSPLDLKEKLTSNLFGLSQIAQLGPYQPYLVTPAIRFGVRQVINAGALFTTAINDTEYEELDRRTLMTIRNSLSLPRQMPEVYLRWALRLPPSHFYGHAKGMTAAFAIWHHTWVGQTLLKGLWTGNGPGAPRRYGLAIPPRPGSHPMFQHGPVARWDTLMASYFLDPNARERAPRPHPKHPGLEILHAAHEAWEDRHRFTDAVKGKIDAAYKKWTLDTINDHKLPETYRQAMRLVVEADRCAPDEPPLWHSLADDLPRAVILFQAPFLGHSRQEDIVLGGRPACAWCAEIDTEWGHHLLTCPRAPAYVTRQRDATLRAIVADVAPADDPTQAPWDSPVNMQRLYHLNWHGKDPQQTARRKYRSDVGRQASAQVLRMAAWYMRTCINAYSTQTEDIGRTKKWPRVNLLKVHGHSPFT